MLVPIAAALSQRLAWNITVCGFGASFDQLERGHFLKEIALVPLNLLGKLLHSHRSLAFNYIN